MILIFETDLTKRNGKRWVWKPMLFRGIWENKRTWRIAWGIFSISYYPSRTLRKFFEYVESGKTSWQ